MTVVICFEPDNDDLVDDVLELLTRSQSKNMALDVLVDSGFARTVHALGEIERAEQRITEMQAARESLGSLRRAQQAALDEISLNTASPSTAGTT